MVKKKKKTTKKKADKKSSKKTKKSVKKEKVKRKPIRKGKRTVSEQKTQKLILKKVHTVWVSLDKDNPDMTDKGVKNWSVTIAVKRKSAEHKKICLLYTSPSPRDS